MKVSSASRHAHGGMRTASSRLLCVCPIAMPQEAAYFMLKKQLESLGVPMWSEAFPNTGEPGIDFNAWNAELRNLLEDGASRMSLKMCLYCSDGGSDQMSFKRILAAGAMNKLTEFFIHVPCMMHCCNLTSKAGLQQVDEWFAQNGAHGIKLFGSMAKLMYVWRDLARGFYLLWCRLFGAESANKWALRIPPRCVAEMAAITVRVTAPHTAATRAADGGATVELESVHSASSDEPTCW